MKLNFKALSSRAAVIHILCQWQKSRSAIDPFIERHTQEMTEPRDRQLVKAIVFGVLRNLNYLDFILGKFSRHPLAKMKDSAREALRSCLYQILFMDRVPESAAINETIKALKSQRQPKWLTGFVNGVLRNICRNKDKIPALNDALPFAVQCNHPEWLLKRWQARFGKQETANICRANNQPASICLRINQNKTSRPEFLELLAQHNYNARPGQAPEAVWLQGGGAINILPGYKEGLFSVQDETAQLITTLLAPFTEGNYLDACAGLGGKTMAMAQMVPAGSTIWAVEPQKARQNLLSENLARLDLQCCDQDRLRGINCFAGTLKEFTETTKIDFQAILVDAPCSGLGVVGRHPDIRWNRQPDDLPRFQKIQLALLQEASQIIAPGGIIVYTTCSMEATENEEVINMFLENQPRFTISTAQVMPEQASNYLDEQGFLHTRPSEKIQDGFFAVRLTAPAKS